jgi:hypothetical protein
MHILWLFNEVMISSMSVSMTLLIYPAIGNIEITITISLRKEKDWRSAYISTY